MRPRSPRRFITILSGDIDHNDTPNFGNRAGNSYHVVRATSTTFLDEIQTSTQLDGFRIIGGNANGSSPDTLGGGMLIELASPVIQNCIFHDNLGNAGGAAHVTGDVGQRPPVPEARPKFVSCAFLGNHGVTEAGAMCNEFGEPEFRNCMFSGNTTDGFGGAIYIDGGAGNATLLAINCTFSGNDANGNGGAIYNGNNATIQNCILYGNTATAGSQIYTPGILPVSITESCVQDPGFQIPPVSLTGTGNTGDNPQFFDADGEDNIYGNLNDKPWLSCATPSTVRDAGDQTLMPADLWNVDDDASTSEKTPDAHRKPRVVNSQIDMGSYEWLGNSCPGDATADGVVDINDLLIVLSDWCNPLVPNCCVGCLGDVYPDICAGDGVVDINDLLLVTGNWGPCPGAANDGEDSPPESVQDCYNMAQTECGEDINCFIEKYEACLESLCIQNLIQCD